MRDYGITFYFHMQITLALYSKGLQCFDNVGWVTGRTSGL